MATQSAFTTVTLRRLPQGESLQIVISGNQSLNILRDKDSGAEIPDISRNDATHKHLILTPAVYGTSGRLAELSECSWKYNGGNWNSLLGSFSSTGVLTILKTPVPAGLMTTPAPFTLTFTAKATINNHTYDVRKDVVINYGLTSGNSYWGAIETSAGTTLDETVTSTTLTPILYLGGTGVKTEYKVKWFRTGTGANGSDQAITSADYNYKSAVTTYLNPNETNNDEKEKHKMWIQDGNNLTVYRDGVDAAAHFEAHFFVDGNEVEAEGVSIVDTADDLQIKEIPDQYAATNGTAKFIVQAYSSKTGNQVNITDKKQLSVVATDSIRQRSYTSNKVTIGVEDNKGSVSMNEANLYVPNTKEDNDGNIVLVDNTKPWLKCAASAADDEAVDSTSKATQCEAILLIGVTIEM